MKHWELGDICRPEPHSAHSGKEWGGGAPHEVSNTQEKQLAF